MGYILATRFFTDQNPNKLVNFGDGIIRDAIIDRLGRPICEISSRNALTNELVDFANKNSKAIVLGGSNTLTSGETIFSINSDQIALKLKKPAQI